MYCPTLFREERVDVMHDLMRAHPLATVVTAGSGGLVANLLPFTLINQGEKGTLRAHLARANGQVEAFREGAETLVIFQGPAAYITPSWYATKAEHGKVVPTWNYVVVQARGTPLVIEDHGWLRAQIDDLTTSRESLRSEPWQVSDAPEDFVNGLLGAIIGIEIPIGRLEGKWKTSQNRTEADRSGVQQGLRREGICEEMAKLVADPAKNK